MKRISKALLLVVFVFILGSCGSEQKSVYENNDTTPGVKSTITYYHKGDEAYKQTTSTVINYKEAGIPDKETAKQAMDAAGAGQYKGVKGIEHSIKYSDTEAVEELSVDYKELDYDKAKTIPGINITGDTKKGISLKASEQLLEASGYKKKK